MPIEEDVELKRKRTPHRDKLLRRERKADEKRTIRVTTIERETFREDHNIGGSRQRFEMPFKVTGLSNDGQSLGSEISANLHMRARRNLPRSHYGNQEEVTGRTLEICNQHSTHSIYISELLGFNPSSLFFYFLNDVYVHDACLIIIRSWRDCQDLWKSASVSTCGIRAKGIKQHNNSCSSIIQRIKTCVLKKTRTWMPIEEDVELKRKRTPHRDKLLRRERKADEKRTIRVTTIERETFREDHNIGGSRQRFEMPFKVNNEIRFPSCMLHLAWGDIAQLVELRSCNWVVAITGWMSNCPGGNDSILYLGSLFPSNGEEDRNMPLKDSIETKMGCQELLVDEERSNDVRHINVVEEMIRNENFNEISKFAIVNNEMRNEINITNEVDVDDTLEEENEEEDEPLDNYQVSLNFTSLKVVRLPGAKLKTFGERGIECTFVGYAKHSKAFRFYVSKPNESVSLNSIIESRDAIFDESRFSSIPRPSQRSLINRTKDIGGLVVLEEVIEEVVTQQPEPELRKDDPKTFDEAIKSHDVAFRKDTINDEMDSILGNNTWVLADLPPGCKTLGCKWIFKRKLKVDMTKEFLSSKFSMNDMGEADLIIGIRIKPKSNKIAISQSHYIGKVLKKFNYFDCTPVSTPMDTIKKLMPNYGQAVSQFEYSRVIGCLMYVMTCTRPDIAFAIFLLGGSAISWASKKQTYITSSTMKYEFVALTTDGEEAKWLKSLILEISLWSKPIAPISILCDSATTLAKAYSQMYNEKSRHLGVRYSMICELITNEVVSIEFVRSQLDLADHLMK
ncbi:zinc finger, CCHC-type containing protein [Tanacetum coccineum]